MICAVISVEPTSRITWFVFTLNNSEWDERPAGVVSAPVLLSA